MATIREIAQLAGVSRGTVDRVLNNRGSVNAQTAQRVREIAEKLNYKPNKAGLMLAAQKKNIKIGIILFPESDAFFKEVLEGIRAREQELAGYNCTLLIRQIPDDDTLQFTAMEELLKEGIHGLVISPCDSLFVAAEIDRFADMGIPVITIHTDITSKRIAYVGSDYYAFGQTAAGLAGLTTTGNVNVGIVTSSHENHWHSKRIEGFTQTLAESYPRIHISATVEAHNDDAESRLKVIQMLSNNPHIKILYFAGGGVYGGCQAVQELGLTSTVRIFTYDCPPSTAELLRSGVITAAICQNPYQQGYLPVDLLARHLLEGIAPSSELHYIPTDIKIKENL